MQEFESKDNPFQTPQEKSESPATLPGDDVRGNLFLTAKIVRVSSVACAIAAALSLFTWTLGFQYLVYEWTWLHTIHVYRIVYVIAFGLLAWRGWCYANTLSVLDIRNPSEFVRYSESLAYLWLSIGLLVFFLIVGTGLMFSAAYANSSGWW